MCRAPRGPCGKRDVNVFRSSHDLMGRSHGAQCLSKMREVTRIAIICGKHATSRARHVTWFAIIGVTVEACHVVHGDRHGRQDGCAWPLGSVRLGAE